MARTPKKLKRHVIDVRVNRKVIGTLELTTDRQKNEVRLKYTGKKTRAIEATWKVDWDTRTLSINPVNLNSFPQGACLIGCLIGAGAAFARCLMKARNEDDVWRCIDEHAGTTGAGVIGCVIGCLN